MKNMLLGKKTDLEAESHCINCLLKGNAVGVPLLLNHVAKIGMLCLGDKIVMDEEGGHHEVRRPAHKVAKTLDISHHDGHCSASRQALHPLPHVENTLDERRPQASPEEEEPDRQGNEGTPTNGNEG